MVDLVEQRIFVIAHVGSGLVSTNCYAVMMCLAEFTAQADVVDPCRVFAVVRWEVERQVMNGVELDHLQVILLHDVLEANRNKVTCVLYSIDPVKSFSNSNS